MHLVVWAAVLLLACGALDPRKKHGVDPEFQPYVDSFEHVSGVDVVDVPIHFGKLDRDEWVGQCTRYNYGYTQFYEITIRRSWWFEHTDPRWRELLIFHELGHCVLYRDHDDTMCEGQPASIMNAVISRFDIDNFGEKKKDYLRELLYNSEALHCHDTPDCQKSKSDKLKFRDDIN